MTSRWFHYRGAWATALAMVLSSGAAAGEAPEVGASGGTVQWRWPAAPHVVAVGDVHGAYDELGQLLKAAGLLGDDGAWSGGATHLVFLGDLIDRGAGSRAVLDLLMKLEPQAEAAGGRLHVVLGNHESMNLLGDMRYVTPAELLSCADAERPEDRESGWARFRAGPEGRDPPEADARRLFNERYPPGFFGHRRLFGPEGRYGRWLLGKPALIVIGDTAFAHGGFASVVAELGGEEINRRISTDLKEYLRLRGELIAAGILALEDGPAESFAKIAEAYAGAEKTLAANGLPGGLDRNLTRHYFVAKRFGQLSSSIIFVKENPLWYRGSVLNPEASERQVFEAALARLDASRAVIGHTPTFNRRVLSRFDGRLIRINTGFWQPDSDGKPAVLIMADEKTEALYPREDLREPPRPDPGEPFLGEPYAEDLTDAQIERFLANAPIIKKEEVPTGVTRPARLTLRQNGLERRAAFKTINQDYLAKPIHVGEKLDKAFTDKYTHDVAAYRLDRLLRLGMVPVTVLRKIDGKEGAVALWVEGALDESKMLELGPLPKDETVARQKELMRVFDALICNVDRNQGNILYSQRGKKLHLIDHSRSFRIEKLPPENLRGQLPIPDPLRARLKELTADQIKRTMGDLLSSAQINALLKRRDYILAPPKPAKS